MSTVEKGDAFENRVFAMLKELMESDQLAIDKKSCRIFQKKGYYSKTQESDIIFDISIEVYMPNAEDYSFLWLVECKDYASPISVDKVRNFNEQVREVGGHKALFVTTSKYQKGAVNHAKSNKMGLMIFNKDSPDWIVRRSTKGRQYRLVESEKYFSGDGIIDTPLIAYDYPNIYENIIDYFVTKGFEVKSNGLRIPYLKDDTISTRAMEVAKLDKKSPVFKMSSSDIMKILNEEYGITLDLDVELQDGELARYCIEDDKILISKTLEFDTPRWRFTIAHELGHVVLHKELLKTHRVEELHYDDNIIASNNITDLLIDQEYERLEIQANKFAGAFLMPQFPLTYHFFCAKDKYDIRYHTLYVGNVVDCENVFSDLSTIFGVSKEAIKYRLINVKLCRDDQAVKD